MKQILCLALLIAFAAGCSGVDQSVLDEQKQLRQEVSALQKDLAELKAAFDTLVTELHGPKLDTQPRKIDLPAGVVDKPAGGEAAQADEKEPGAAKK